MPDDRAFVELLITQDASQQRRLPGPVPTHKSDLGIAGNGAFGVVEQDLVTVAFRGISYLQEDRHGYRGNSGRVLDWGWLGEVSSAAEIVRNMLSQTPLITK